MLSHIVVNQYNKPNLEYYLPMKWFCHCSYFPYVTPRHGEVKTEEMLLKTTQMVEPLFLPDRKPGLGVLTFGKLIQHLLLQSL